MGIRDIVNKIVFLFKALMIVLSVSVGIAETALAEDKADILRIRWVIDEALRSNPQFKSAELNWDASKERVPQARALDDPNLGFTYYGEQTQTRVGEVQAGFMASQKNTLLWKTQAKRRGC